LQAFLCKTIDYRPLYHKISKTTRFVGVDDWYLDMDILLDGAKSLVEKYFPGLFLVLHILFPW
jgi:hypothetical protein